MDFYWVPKDLQKSSPLSPPPIWSLLIYMLLTETLNINDRILRQVLNLPGLQSNVTASILVVVQSCEPLHQLLTILPMNLRLTMLTQNTGTTCRELCLRPRQRAGKRRLSARGIWIINH